MRTLFPHNTFFAHRARKRGFLGLIIGFVILSTSVEVRAQTDWWTAVGGPYGGTTVWDLERLADGSILAATSNGVHRSLDNGYTWTAYSQGLTTFDVRDIQFDQRGTPYIATYGSGVYQLNPWSNTWLPVRSGLNGHWRVTSMAYDTYGNAWIGTVDGGLFRHGTAGVHVGSEADLPESHDLGIPWPNPSTGPVSVTVTLPQAEEIHINVIDVLGRRVLNQHLMLSAGQHDLRLDIPASASGVYWIRSSSARHVVSRSVTVIR
ncbi:MAG: T9SS type A sorting domain-containing protein [Rhodothermales bacterium]|jgi:hypothetical protein